MISTDKVKAAADDLTVLDSQAIADNLNQLQSQKFVDPNCHPTKDVVSIDGVGFCDNPLEDRDKRLDEFMKKIPALPSPADTSKCAQEALNKIQKLIDTKFSMKNLERDTKITNFAEEKFEAQLTLVTYMTLYVWSLVRVRGGLSTMVKLVTGYIQTSIDAITKIETDAAVPNFEKTYSLQRLNRLLLLLKDIDRDKDSYNVLINPENEFLDLQIKQLKIFTTGPVIKEYNNFIRQLNKKITYKQRKQSEKFGNVYKAAGNIIKKAKSPSIDTYTASVIAGKTKLLDDSYKYMLSLADKGAIKRYAFLTKGTKDVEHDGHAKKTKKFLEEAYTDLVEFFEYYVNQTPKPPTEKDVIKEIANIDICGKKITPTPGGEPDAPSPANVAWNTFDVNNKPTVTEIDYWKRYSVYLTLVNLIPTYWTVGLYVPSSSGITKIKLPTVWRPLAVLDVGPFGLIVIFLTINGIAISPTVWLWKFIPFGKNESSMFSMMRAKNKKIKDNTGDALDGVPIVNGININPALTKMLPFKQDDLPAVKRLGMNNIPYIAYLNQWMKQYKTGGGLP